MDPLRLSRGTLSLKYALWGLFLMVASETAAYSQASASPTTVGADASQAHGRSGKWIPPLSASVAGSLWGSSVDAGAAEVQVSAAFPHFDLSAIAVAGASEEMRITWFGAQIAAPVVISGPWRASVGGGFGRYQESNDLANRSGWTLTSALDVQRELTPGVAIYTGARWIAGVGRWEGRYGIPVGSAGVRLGQPSQHRSMLEQHPVLFALAGVVPGIAGASEVVRPALRAGVGIPLGAVRADVFGELHHDGEVFAHREGVQLLVPILRQSPGAMRLVLEAGTSGQYYTERLASGETLSAVMGGGVINLGFVLNSRATALLQVERSWGEARAGHMIRTDAVLAGIRYRL